MNDMTLGQLKRQTTLSSPIADALAGALILAVGIGIGRFAFTGLYPLMVRDGVLTVSSGSLVASANYLGYLVGAVMLSQVHQRHAARLCQVAMTGTVLCLAAASLTSSLHWMLGMRLISGVFSALAMVSATTWLFQVVGSSRSAPVLFSGIGAGILVSAELIAASNRVGLHSAAIWLVLAAAAALLCALAWARVGRESIALVPDQAASIGPVEQTGRVIRPWLMIVVYGLAGFGYIVPATYLPLFVKNALGGVNALQVWAAFGLGAIPSCFLWDSLHHWLGSRRAMILNLAVQTAGVLMPVLSPTVPAFVGCAVLVGSTFVGAVTIAMTAAKGLAASLRYNVAAAMTAAYGVGQIAGPLASSMLLTRSTSFNPPLIAAAAGLVFAALGCLIWESPSPRLSGIRVPE